MRFELSQVMDAIEQRLTTDAVGAQAVVDMGEVVRQTSLDNGRAMSVVRIGMVVDALARYLVDGGALLYPVADRSLLSEGGLTSKERMVLGRWADDGALEVVTDLADRVTEIARLTGVPVITLAADGPLPESYAALATDVGRVLRVVRRGGLLTLCPVDGERPDSRKPDGAQLDGHPTDGEPADAGQDTDPGQNPAARDGGAAIGRAPVKPDHTQEPAPVPEQTVPVAIFADRGVTPATCTRVSRHRFLRAEPDQTRAGLLSRAWRCDEFECACFGDVRRHGQPPPRIRDGVAICPRHDKPLTDVGPRPAAYPVSLVVDDLPRQRRVVREGTSVEVGRMDEAADTGDFGDPDAPGTVSVARWLHASAAAWVSRVHVRLEASADGLVVTDESANGTVLWHRTGPDDPGHTSWLHHQQYVLGEWDSVELYTGVELYRGDRRASAVMMRHEPASVLRDAPTAAYHQVSGGDAATVRADSR